MSEVQKKFTEAINTMFNFDNNIFIVATVETILREVKAEDYKAVIMHLAKRNSEFETSLNSLAKGIDEFYKAKREKLLDYARDHAMDIDLVIMRLVEQEGKDKTINLFRPGRFFKANNKLIEVTHQDAQIIIEHGGLNHLLEERKHIGGILYRCISKSTDKSSNEPLLLGN